MSLFDPLPSPTEKMLGYVVGSNSKGINFDMLHVIFHMVN